MTKSPAGAHQWQPKGGALAGTAPDPHDPTKHRTPNMLTTDIALKVDPIYEKISRRFYENPDQLADAFARAWFKLIHRDMGPRSRYLGPEVPAEELIWQDPVPAVDHELIDAQDIANLKGKILASGLSIPELVSTAWASACHVPRLRQARRCQRGAYPPGAAKGLASQPAGPTGEGPQSPGGHPTGVQRRAVRREKGVAG